jgi:UDP-glucuronate 4-epimerase
MRVLVTGAAGFIGSSIAARLLDRGDSVLGIDNLNDYYDVALKDARLQKLVSRPGFSFLKVDVSDRGAMASLFQAHRPERVLHLAAQAGVRYSLVNPHAYVDANVTGFLTILEGCRQVGAEHLVYASSSSVYGGNTRLPFSEHHPVDHPVSLYAATKKANELMAHAYSHLFHVPTTGLRFFTVYGPWGRPDMALFLFTKAILTGSPIDIFNHGSMTRDFTYIDDIVEGVIRVLDRPAKASTSFDPYVPDPATSHAPFRIFNIGNSQPTSLLTYIDALEGALGVTAERRFLPMQPGDVEATAADASELEAWTGFRPATPIQDGIGKFVDWYRAYYRI